MSKKKGAWADGIGRCKALTKMVWWRREPMPCKLPAWKDGYCRKHHPARRAERGDVSKELAMCRKTLTEAQARVVRAKEKLAELEAEQRNWIAFMEGVETDVHTGRKSLNEGVERHQARETPKISE